MTMALYIKYFKKGLFISILAIYGQCTKGLIGKTMGLKKDTIGLGKSMNGADLPVFLFEVNGANLS